MSICLSHASADRILELFAHKGVEMEPVSSSAITQFGANVEDIQMSCDVAEMLGERIEVIVGNERAARQSKQVVCHKWTERLPEGALLRVPDSDGVYVSSPAFCLLQQAAELHVVNLCMMLGRYLATGSPAMGKNGVEVLSERQPLVKEEDLYGFIKEASGDKGVRRLKEALRWTCPGAASPQETNLQLILTLPLSYHGFGLALPHMNYEVALDTYARKIYPRKTCRIDLCWPERRFGLEYQGKEHGGQLEADWSRHYALVSQQYELLYVTSSQLYSAVQIEFIARQVARKTGKRIREGSWPKAEETQYLLDVLAGRAIPKVNEFKRRVRSRKSRRRA